MLPFKRRKTTDVKVIEDGLGNSLEVPFYGCLTPNEKLDFVNLRLTLPQVEGMSQSKFELFSVASFLSRRFNQDISPDDLAEQAGSFQMIHALYEFLEGEERAWEAKSQLMEIIGEESEQVAIDYAQSVGGVVASRKDLIGRHFVFRSTEDVPIGYDVTEGKFQSEQQEESPPNQLKNNSPISTGNLGEDFPVSSNSTKNNSGTAP